MSLYSYEEICEGCMNAVFHGCEKCVPITKHFCHCKIGKIHELDHTECSCGYKKYQNEDFKCGYCGKEMNKRQLFCSEECSHNSEL